ncbi:MAG: histone deacetylase family protein [Planctomycetota bacterium]|jgi:acetoin utilization deacetylase AcuC-like enzyme
MLAYMAATALIQDSRFQRHRTGEGHPERPERLIAIEQALGSSGLAARCETLEPVPVSIDVVGRLHDSAYLDRLRMACGSGAPYIDVMDSSICTESMDIALLASGSALAAVDHVMSGAANNAFCAIRPPGHHAEKSLSMGFCLFNNIALAADHLMEQHGISRVLVVDFDVHHGNGTQHIFEEDSRVMFISLHGHPRFVYPGTGYAEERGKGDGEGTTVNVPMLPGSKDDDYRRAFDEAVLPPIDDFRPEFVLVSAGFDAHERDPLAPLDLSTSCFGWMTDALLQAARRHCDGRLVSLLEGGYDLQALSESVVLHVSRLLESPAG